MSKTHVDFVRNHMDQGHAAYHDTEHHDAKIKIPAGGIQPVEEKIPKWYDLHDHFDKHYVHVTNTENSKEWWLWEYKDEIRYRDTKPKWGEYGSGSKLCDSGGHIAIEITEDGKLDTKLLCSSEAALFDDVQTLAATVLAKNQQIAKTVHQAASEFWQTPSGQPLLKKQRNAVGLTGLKNQTNYPAQFQAFPMLAQFAPGNGIFGPDGNLHTTGAISFGTVASLELGAGVSASVAEAVDSDGEFGGLISMATTAGPEIGVDLTFELGFWLGALSDLAGYSCSALLSVSEEVGLYAAVYFDVDLAFQGLVLGFAEGVDVQAAVGVGWTSYLPPSAAPTRAVSVA